MKPYMTIRRFNRIKRQLLCYASVRGRETMHCYDDLPTEVRTRLRTSPFNLCAACIGDERSAEAMFMMIEQMEEQCRDDNEPDNHTASQPPEGGGEDGPDA